MIRRSAPAIQRISILDAVSPVASRRLRAAQLMEWLPEARRKLWNDWRRTGEVRTGEGYRGVSRLKSGGYEGEAPTAFGCAKTVLVV